MFARRGIHSLGAVVLSLFVAVAHVHGGTADHADAVVIASSDTTALLQFADSVGGQVFVSFSRAHSDDPWLPTSEIAPAQWGIVFGNAQPRLPGAAQLRDRDIAPASVVKEFSPAIADESFDDVTIYQLPGGEMVIALHQNGLVTSIHIAGSFFRFVQEILSGDVDHCQAAKNACCRTTDYPDGDDDDVTLPNPYINGCLLVWGGACVDMQMQSDACNCLAKACNCAQPEHQNYHPICEQNNNNQEACVQHCHLCGGPCGDDDDDDDDDDDGDENDLNDILRELIDLLKHLFDLLAM